MKTYVVISVDERNARTNAVLKIQRLVHEIVGEHGGSIVLRSSDGASGSHYTDHEWAAVDATFHQHIERSVRKGLRSGKQKFEFVVPASGETHEFTRHVSGDTLDDAVARWAQHDGNVDPERWTWWGIPFTVRRIA